MDRASRIVVTLLSLCAIAAAGNTNFFSQSSPNAVSAAKEIRQTPDAVSTAPVCNRSTLCCKLGRRAVRLSYSAMYTCKIEALSQGLEYHTSASQRLKHKALRNGNADRMDAANTLHRSFGFRRRLMLCESKGQAHKQCFQDCCERKLREEQARAKKIASRQNP